MIVEQCRPDDPPPPVARLRIARIFRLPGRGVVVAGKIVDGMIRKGDTLRLSRDGWVRRLAVTAVEFLDCNAARRFEIGVVCREDCEQDAEHYAGLFPAATVIAVERDAPADVLTFIGEFESGVLPKSRWTHEAHLTAGLWYVWTLGFDAALPVVRRRISAYNEAVGTANTDVGGYHETLTRFYLTRIAQLKAASPAASFAQLLQATLRSRRLGREAPLQHYSRERLFSVAARRQWLEPDLDEE